MGSLLHEIQTPTPRRAPAPAGAGAGVGADGRPAADAATLPGPVCVDTHAHLHPAFGLGRALRAAAGHARRAGAGACVLCLTRTPAETAFERLAAGEAADGLRFVPSATEPEVLFATPAPAAEASPELVLVDGLQLVSSERVEVLALAVPPDAAAGLRAGLPLEATLAAVAASGAVPVLPHGVGKWLGRRGRLVSRLLDVGRGTGAPRPASAPWAARLCVADNAGRFTVGPRPAILDQAAALGVTVLAGSDPLPLRGCGSRLGGMGVVLGDGLPRDAVAATLRRVLPGLGPAPRSFGGHAGFLGSTREQAALRLLGRRQKAARGGGK